MMLRRAYLETSVISYLAARPSRDLVVAARQQLTHEWWRRRRPDFELYVSELVLAEVAAGDPEVAERRIEILAGLPSLTVTKEATDLGRFLVQSVGLPAKARADALHIALAACHGIEYLLTWNSTHIANAELRPRVEAACRRRGYEPPVLCTPDELMGG
jgi:predicted nucleic acid-binding protein